MHDLSDEIAGSLPARSGNPRARAWAGRFAWKAAKCFLGGVRELLVLLLYAGCPRSWSRGVGGTDQGRNLNRNRSDGACSRAIFAALGAVFTHSALRGRAEQVGIAQLDEDYVLVCWGALLFSTRSGAMPKVKFFVYSVRPWSLATCLWARNCGMQPAAYFLSARSWC